VSRADEPLLPAALIFDLDGTILDTETPEFAAIRTVWAEHGHEYSAARFTEVVGTTSGTGWLEELEARAGRAIDRAAARARHHAVHRELTDALQPRPGIEALVAEAIALGIPMAVASNSPRWWVRERVDAVGLTHALGVIVSLDDSSAPKPHPAPYLEACAALGAEPRRSVAFEDSTTGVRSAVSAGLYTVACAGPLTIGHDLSEADLVIGAHTEVTISALALAVGARNGSGVR
jgi:HAD superfamily hydrolase (TIGR01509 family)